MQQLELQSHQADGMPGRPIACAEDSCGLSLVARGPWGRELYVPGGGWSCQVAGFIIFTIGAGIHGDGEGCICC